MKKRLSTGILLVMLLGGFLCYEQSHVFSTITAFNNLSFTNQKKYSDNMVEFIYPANWQVERQAVAGNEILHHVNYRDINRQVMGYVQVWVTVNTLPEFLQKSRISFADSTDTDIKDLSMKQLQNDKYQGYLLAYERNGLPNSFVAREYFFEHAQYIYRISLFVAGDTWNDYYQQVFDQLVASFIIY